MTVVLHRNFRKGLENLTSNQKKRVGEILQLFKDNPYDPQLKNHALHGKQKGLRAIYAGGDLRLVFKEENDCQRVIFVRVGTHNQVYE